VSRRVDPYIYVHEWVWRHSKANGTVRYVLLRIARAMRWTPDGFETPPLPVQDIADDTGLVDSTVRRHLEELGAEHGDLEIVRGTRRGETYRYRLRREQLLPLADLRPAPDRRQSALRPPTIGGENPPPPPPTTSGDTADPERSDRRPSAVTPPAIGADQAGGVLFSRSVQVPSTTPTEEVPVPTEEGAAAGFVAWFAAEYLVRRGVPYRVDRVKAEAVARELLRDHPRRRLEAMAVLMFDAVRDSFIVGSDYSLFVLQHKATYLASIAVRNERQEATG
jgi:hypothetical protein